MLRRLRPLAAGAAVAALFVCVGTPAAQAFVTTDVSWSLSETTKTYGGGTQFHISQDGDGTVSYRWLDGDMTKSTVVSGNTCTDYALLGKSSFSGGDTNYHLLFLGFNGECFVLRGRTDTGTTITHNGRLRR